MNDNGEKLRDVGRGDVPRINNCWEGNGVVLAPMACRRQRGGVGNRIVSRGLQVRYVEERLTKLCGDMRLRVRECQGDDIQATSCRETNKNGLNGSMILECE